MISVRILRVLRSSVRVQLCYYQNLKYDCLYIRIVCPAAQAQSLGPGRVSFESIRTLDDDRPSLTPWIERMYSVYEAQAIIYTAVRIVKKRLTDPLYLARDWPSLRQIFKAKSFGVMRHCRNMSQIVPGEKHILDLTVSASAVGGCGSAPAAN